MYVAWPTGHLCYWPAVSGRSFPSEGPIVYSAEFARSGAARRSGQLPADRANRTLAKPS